MLEKMGKSSRFAVAGYHAVICDAFIPLSKNKKFPQHAMLDKQPMYITNISATLTMNKTKLTIN